MEFIDWLLLIVIVPVLGWTVLGHRTPGRALGAVDVLGVKMGMVAPDHLRLAIAGRLIDARRAGAVGFVAGAATTWAIIRAFGYNPGLLLLPHALCFGGWAVGSGASLMRPNLDARGPGPALTDPRELAEDAFIPAKDLRAARAMAAISVVAVIVLVALSRIASLPLVNTTFGFIIVGLGAVSPPVWFAIVRRMLAERSVVNSAAELAWCDALRLVGTRRFLGVRSLGVYGLVSMCFGLTDSEAWTDWFSRLPGPYTGWVVGAVIVALLIGTGRSVDFAAERKLLARLWPVLSEPTVVTESERAGTRDWA